MSVGRGLPSTIAQGYFETLAQGSPTTPDLVRSAAVIWDLPLSDVHGRCKRRITVQARSAAIVLSVYKRELSYCHVGRAMSRDHTTMIHSANTALRMITKDPHFATRVRDVWNLACAGKASMSRAEMDSKAKRAEIISAAEIAAVRKAVKEEVGKTASGNERESGCWTHNQLAEMDRRFRVALTAFGKGMTYEVPR